MITYKHLETDLQFAIVFPFVGATSPYYVNRVNLSMFPKPYGKNEWQPRPLNKWMATVACYSFTKSEMHPPSAAFSTPFGLAGATLIRRQKAPTSS